MKTKIICAMILCVSWITKINAQCQLSISGGVMPGGECITSPTYGFGMHAPQASTYNWSGPNGFTANTQFVSITPATIADSGMYHVTITNPVDCPGLADTTLSILIKLMRPPIPQITFNIPFCSPNVEFTGHDLGIQNGPPSYLWTDDGNLTTQTISVLSSGGMGDNHSLYITNGWGCFASTWIHSQGNNTIPNPSVAQWGPDTICAGDSVRLTVYYYQWPMSVPLQWMKNGVAIPGATNDSFYVKETGVYNVAANNNGCIGISYIGSDAHITVLSKPKTIITTSGATTFCSGGNVTLFVTPTNNSTYQWLKNNNSISGATATNYSATAAGKYKVVKTNIYGCSKTSPATVVTVNPLPAAQVTANGPLSFCAGGSVTFTASAGAGYIYQWKKGANPINGATNINYTAITGGNYKVIVSNSYSCSRTSANQTVTIPCRENGENISEVGSVKAFPNPVNDILNLDINHFTGNGWVYIINSLGQTVVKKEIDFDVEGLKEINMSGVSSGIYTVMAAGMNSKEMIRVVKN